MSSSQITPQKIANYFIAVSNDTQSLITNMKLQKLVYYAQAWHLAAFDKSIFDEDFRAWIHGPVAPSLYHRYKGYGYQPILEEQDESSNIAATFSESINEILDDVIAEYFDKNAHELERLTHSEDPWIIARAGLPDDTPSNNVIQKTSMQQYYKSFLINNA